MSYLVDSDWIIDALAGIPTALTPLQQHARDGLSVSIVTFGEVFEMTRNVRHFSRIHGLKLYQPT